MKILVKLTGSIAAWKACGVISRLVQDGHEVQTIATEAALHFVGPATLEGLTRRPVRSNMWATGTAMDHINLVKWADLVLLCPATANTINRLAAGLADDLVGSLFLAHDRRKPYLVAPAMNPAMWAHPATVAAVEKLRSWGVQVLPVARGRVACGDDGEGRMLEPEAILEIVRVALATASRGPAVARRRILVTSGGTEEPIDGVRSLGNFSTGATGALIADVLAARGHAVTLLRGHRAARPVHPGVTVEDFVSFADLEADLERLLAGGAFDAVVHAAAVGDYAIAGVEIDGVAKEAFAAGKIDSGCDVALRLRANPKLVDSLRAWSAPGSPRIVAFKLTRSATAAEARAAIARLFAHAKPDAVVHNDLSELDAATGTFPAAIWTSPEVAEPTARVQTRRELALALEQMLANPNETAPGNPLP